MCIRTTGKYTFLLLSLIWTIKLTRTVRESSRSLSPSPSVNVFELRVTIYVALPTHTVHYENMKAF